MAKNVIVAIMVVVVVAMLIKIIAKASREARRSYMRCFGAADAASGGRTSKDSAICGKFCPVQLKQGTFLDIYSVLLGVDRRRSWYMRALLVRCW